jgi:hypothetical protein
MFNVKQFVGVLLVEAVIAAAVVKVRRYGESRYYQGKAAGLLAGAEARSKESKNEDPK